MNTNKVMIKDMKDRGQDGLVSIFSVLIIMAILTLLMVGFSNITRRAQQRTLDDQLSAQAFYAAESGINQALSSGALVSKDNCTLGGSFNYDVDGETGDDDLDVGISCLLIDVEPPSLAYDPVSAVGEAHSQPWIVYAANSATGTNIDQFRFFWDVAGGQTGAPSITSPVNGSNPSLVSKSDWGSSIGMLRVDIVPEASIGTRAAMATSSYSFFLRPTASTTEGAARLATSSISPGTANQGVALGYQCSSTGSWRCAATISLDSSLRDDGYYIRVQSYYNATSVMIEGQAGASSVSFRGGQALIDSTGRVANVYRRIQVREPLFQPVGYHEAFSILSADSICKRIVSVSGVSPIVHTGPSTGDDAGVCNPNAD